MNRWKKCEKTEDGKFIPIDEIAFSLSEEFWIKFQLWIDEKEWLWNKGILRYGNFLYRLIYSRGTSKKLFNHKKDYRELCDRVYTLEQELKELKGEETSESWKRRREEEDRKRSEELIKMGPGPDLSETIMTPTGHW